MRRRLELRRGAGVGVGRRGRGPAAQTPERHASAGGVRASGRAASGTQARAACARVAGGVHAAGECKVCVGTGACGLRLQGSCCTGELLHVGVWGEREAPLACELVELKEY